MSRGRLGLIGAGAVGPVLARRLAERGFTVGTIASRRIESAREAVRFVGSGRASATNADAAEGADLLLLAVPDRAVAFVAREIAESGRATPDSLVLHFSGALSSRVLSPLAERGAATGSIHPLQSFANPETALGRLPRTWLFYEGDAPDRIRSVAGDLSENVAAVDREGKALYHAGAAAACNLFVAMVDLGVRLMEAAGIPEAVALPALLPLVEGTVGNLADVGLPHALTGPVARGDVETVRSHLDAIRDRVSELLPAYAEASRHAIRVALEKGTLSEEAASKLRGLLTR